MQISSRFTIAIHTLLCIHTFYKEHKTTSDFIAKSVNVNAVIIRKTLGQLKAAGLVRVFAGSGGSEVAKDLRDISLLDVYKSVESVKGNLFSFHGNPNPSCPVGKNIRFALDEYLLGTEQAMEAYLQKTSLQDVADKLQKTV